MMRLGYRAPLVALALLSLTAGFSDGYGLARYGVFVANQSGNLVHVGMGLVGEFSGWTLALVSFAGFAIGVMVSSQVARMSGKRGWFVMYTRLTTVIVLVVIWSVTMAVLGDTTDHEYVSTVLGAAAMGVLATSLTRVGDVEAQTTYQTGTVLHSAQGLMDWLGSPTSVGRRGRVIASIGVLTIVCYVAGGALGAVVGAHVGAWGLLIAVVPMVVVLALIHRNIASFRDEPTTPPEPSAPL